MVIKSGSSKPGYAYVVVCYLNMLFGIDKRDHLSKRSLQFALTPKTLLDSDDKVAAS